MQLKGQRPRLSPDGLRVAFAYGRKVHVVDLATGKDRIVGAGHMPGWLDNETLTWIKKLSNKKGSARFVMHLGQCKPLEVGTVRGVGFTVRSGWWAAMRLKPRAFVMNGAAIMEGQYLGQQIDLDPPSWACGVRTPYGVMVSQPDCLVRHPVSGEVLSLCVRAGYVVADIRGQDVVGWQEGSDIAEPLGITPWGHESQPKIVLIGDDTWVASLTVPPGTPDGQAVVLLRPWGERACLQVPGCIGELDAVVRDGEFVVVSGNTKGQIRVERIAVDAPREELNLPAIPRVPFGYWEGRFSERRGDNPNCPGNAAIVMPMDPAVVQGELPALERAISAGGGLIIGAEYIGQATAAWGSVQAVYVSSEDSLDQCAARARAAKNTMATCGLEARPVVSYTARLPGLPADVDLLGVECYLDAHETVAAFETRIRKRLAEVKAAGRKAGLIWGAVRRAGVEVSDLLAAQGLLWRLLADYQGIVGIVLVWNDGRPEGCRTYPQLYEPHRKVLEAMK